MMMLNALGQVFIGVPLRIVHDISTSLYCGIQRVVALTFLPNQRFNYSYFASQELKTRRLSILSTAKHEHDSPLIKEPKVVQVNIQNSLCQQLEGIVMGPAEKIVLQDGKLKVHDRLLVAYSGIGGCYENWYYEGLKDLYENFDTSILMVNYRGVGKSCGQVSKPTDLIEDGYAIALYAYQELALDPLKIHFYGASMGGGVATHVVARLEKEGYKPASVCIDRSYSGFLHTIQEILPLDFLKILVMKILTYACWEIDSVAAAAQIAYAKLVVIRAEADSVIPMRSSLGTALLDRTEGKASFKLIDLPPDEKTDYEKMHEPGFPTYAKFEMEQTYLGQIKLSYMRWQSFIQKVFIGIRAHCTPFSKKLYPEQAEAYHQVIKTSEGSLRLGN